MSGDDWQKIIAAFGIGTIPIGLFKWWTERKAAREKSALELLAQNSKQHADVDVAERNLLPQMMKLYTDELKSLRQELRDTTARMEREAIRMRQYIAQVHGDYAFVRALATQGGRKNTHLPLHEKVPSFSD